MKLNSTNVKVGLTDGAFRNPSAGARFKPSPKTPIEGVVKKSAKGVSMKTSKVGQKVTLKAKPGQKKISFKKGGLHAALGVPQGKKIPAGKKAAAIAGKYGAKAKREALFAKNVLTGRK